MILLDEYIEHIEVGEKQPPKLSRKEQEQWYQTEREFKYFQRLMIPSWISYHHTHDMYL